MKPKKNLNSFYWLNNLLNVSSLKKNQKTCANAKLKVKYIEKKASNF